MIFRMRSQLLSTLLLISFHSIIVRGQQACYYPDGTQATNDVACYPTNSSVSNAFCCGPGYACLDNKVCGYTDIVAQLGSSLTLPFIRGSCTDPTWQSGNCPQFCINAVDNNLDGGNNMEECTENVGYWCCSSNQVGCSCATNVNTTLLSGDTKAITTIDFTASTTSTTSSSSTSTEASTTSSSSSTTTAASSVQTGASSQTSTSASTNIPAATGLSSSAKVGLGLGIPLGLIVIGAIGFFVFRSKKHSRAQHHDSLGRGQDRKGLMHDNANSSELHAYNQPQKNRSELPGYSHADSQYPQGTGHVPYNPPRNPVYEIGGGHR